ncbi:MAG: TIGR01777 family oxidoreductase [Gemmatales bacterium]|nr:TIGR01777 family oxidoreductase [Gemmatales bacterium]MDW8175373.1 TIGR01777 family oxidoreductase [Gemmatales bacterium]
MARVLVSGSSGLIGSALVPSLQAAGHEVARLVRRPTQAPNEIFWNPETGELDRAALEGFDAVIHLSGFGIAERRWNDEVKALIRNSRVQSTKLLAEALTSLSVKPRVLASASAVGYYGDRGMEELSEESPPGKDFLAQVCQEWESAALSAASAGIRVVCCRLGVVLSERGGALAKVRLPFLLCLGGRIGSGQQYWSWIHHQDAVRAFLFVLDQEALAGPVNFTSPEPVTNAEFTRTLGRVLRRPTIFPMPRFAARLVFGEMADALFLSSARVRPKKLLDAGFNFDYPNLEAALRHLLQRPATT